MKSDSGVEFWKTKARRRAEISFGADVIPDYAVSILDRLAKEPTNVVEERNLQEIA